MTLWKISPIYKSAFGFTEVDPKHGEIFRIVGHVERWPGWEDRLRGIIEAHNEISSGDDRATKRVICARLECQMRGACAYACPNRPALRKDFIGSTPQKEQRGSPNSESTAAEVA